MLISETVRRFAGTGGDRPGQPGSGARIIPAATLAKPVMIVEDEAMIAWALESLLEDIGFQSIYVASTGEEALRIAERVRPDLIITDVNLGPSGIDGISAASGARHLLQSRVIFVSGHIGPQEMQRIQTHLPDAIVLRKPVGKDELFEAIATITRPSG